MVVTMRHLNTSKAAQTTSTLGVRPDMMPLQQMSCELKKDITTLSKESRLIQLLSPFHMTMIIKCQWETITHLAQLWGSIEGPQGREMSNKCKDSRINIDHQGFPLIQEKTSSKQGAI
jgi:hypothetical protein